MNTRKMTYEQIRISGLAALHNELGSAGMVRFLYQFETGSGDYSLDRHKWVNNQDVQSLVEIIQKRRNKK